MNKKVDILAKKMKMDFKKIHTEVCSYYNLPIEEVSYCVFYHNLYKYKPSNLRNMSIRESRDLFAKYFIGYIKCHKPTYYQYLRKHMKCWNNDSYNLLIGNTPFEIATDWFVLLEDTF